MPDLPTKTPEHIKEWVAKVEQVSGLKCLGLRDLPQEAIIEEIEVAFENDNAWFKGMAETIMYLCY